MKYLAMMALLVLGTSGAEAACDVEGGAYHSQKSLPTADAYIGCLEPLVATPGFGVVSPGFATGITVTPSFGPVAPGNPNGMPIEQYLQQIKAQGGYTDYEWTQVMASAMSTDASMAVVYDKNQVAPEYAAEQPFEVTAISPRAKLKQYFVDPAKFRDLSTYALESVE